jgi:hypothetical protein
MPFLSLMLLVSFSTKSEAFILDFYYLNEAKNAYKSKSVTYKNIPLKKGDIIKATMFVRFAKRDCQSIIDLKDNKFKKAFVIKEVSIVVR